MQYMAPPCENFVKLGFRVGVSPVAWARAISPERIKKKGKVGLMIL